MLVARQRFPEAPALDLPARIREQLARVLGRIQPRSRIAVAVGSRGISNLNCIVGAVVEGLQAAGARPFIVPAMGSHGGGTPEGQAALLAEYGITEGLLGAPIEAAIEVESLGTTANGFEVFFSAAALRADGIVLVNRIKPHTDFTGTIGSGLLKMLVVGLGKPRGAANFHAAASRLGYEAVLRQTARLLLARTPVLCGLGIVENQRHQTAKLAGLLPTELESHEAALCTEARALMPRLPLEDIDLLIVDRLGKNISGAGMDPAVTGRSIHGYVLQQETPAPPPRVRRLFVRDLTPQTHGNATGIGLADFTTTRLVQAIDWHVTALNALTALSLQGSKVPLHFETDRQAIGAALRTLALPPGARPVVARIRDTLSLDLMELSEAAWDQAQSQPGLELASGAANMAFEPDGNLVAFRAG
jgi:hypothetical protein